MDLWTEWELGVGEEEDGRNWEGSRETHTSPYVKQIANGKWLCNTGSSAWYSDSLEGWDGVGVGGRFNSEGTYVYLWLILVVWQKPTLHCETIILQLKMEKNRKAKRMFFSKFGVMSPNAYVFLDLSSPDFIYLFIFNWVGSSCRLSLVAESRGYSLVGVVLAGGLSHPKACGIFLDKGADSLPLDHQGKSWTFFLVVTYFVSPIVDLDLAPIKK